MSSIYICSGRVGQDPETGKTNSGTDYANWSMAIKENVKQEEPEWQNFVAYQKVAEVVGKYVKKGDMLNITRAYPRNRKWTDKQGNDRITTEYMVRDIELLPNPKRDSSSQKPVQGYNPKVQEQEKDGLPFDL